MGKVYIIGMGPGSEDYVTPAAEKKIHDADIIIAAPRLLALCSRLEKKAVPLKENYQEVVEYIERNRDQNTIAVIVSGDPGLFSYSSRITGLLPAGEYEIIPGISSLQLACARVGESWHDMYIVSLHGKDINGLEESVIHHQKVFLLCDGKNTPGRIASYLLEKGIEDGMCFAFQNLSLKDEKIIRADIRTFQTMNNQWTGLWVMMIKR